MLSLSSRRAWIEMLAEIKMKCVEESLSSRRAWIEILFGFGLWQCVKVALLAESVD